MRIKIREMCLSGVNQEWNLIQENIISKDMSIIKGRLLVILVDKPPKVRDKLGHKLN